MKLEQIDVVCESILNGAEISDDLRNGDVIKAIFPNIVVEEQSKDLFIVFNMDFQGTPFYKTWWNAPYQKGGKNDRNRKKKHIGTCGYY